MGLAQPLRSAADGIAEARIESTGQAVISSEALRGCVVSVLALYSLLGVYYIMHWRLLSRQYLA